ncbi:DUF2752 domain-containing protein [Candidatus Allofournierella merdipullorum]|uniref:DUF2752 domain-containing protein n=1 Tax=Candidatus Allofournierella merdipullorum TaxID=2838595 RepID=UPI00374FA868
MKKQDLAALAAIAALYVALHFLGMGCPIKAITGVSCAGCGMTRAWLEVLSGNWAAAFAYHPLFWTIPLGVLVFLFRRRLPRRLTSALLWAAGIAFVAVYAVRLADPTDSVVVFAPEAGLFHRILRLLPLGK